MPQVIESVHVRPRNRLTEIAHIAENLDQDHLEQMREQVQNIE